MEELPEAISKAAYSPEDPPAPRELENLVVIAENHIPLRGTSKLLKKDKGPDEVTQRKKETAEKKVDSNNMRNLVPGMTPHFGDMAAMGPFAMMMAQMWQQQLMMGKGNEAKVTLSPKKEKELQEEKNKKEALSSAAAAFKPQERQLALLDTDIAEGQKKEVDTEGTAEAMVAGEKKTPHDFEKATFGALKAKKKTQKENAKEKAKAATPKSKAKAKAKAKNKEGKNKKKSPTKTLQYEIPPWSFKDMHVDKNTYTSRHWHAARSFAKKHFAMGDDEAKIYAKGIREAAAEIYDEHKPPKKSKKE